MVGEQADGLELVVIEQVGLVDDDDGGAAALGVFGGERVGGLREPGWRGGSGAGRRGRRRCGGGCRAPRRSGRAGR